MLMHVISLIALWVIGTFLSHTLVELTKDYKELVYGVWSFIVYCTAGAILIFGTVFVWGIFGNILTLLIKGG